VNILLLWYYLNIFEIYEILNIELVKNTENLKKKCYIKEKSIFNNGINIGFILYKLYIIFVLKLHILQMLNIYISFLLFI